MDNKYSLQIFDSTLGTCKIELLSDKSAIRNKAFAQLQDFLDRRSDEIHELVKSNEYKSDTTWESLFNAALDGIVIHVEQIKSKAANSALINKCALYEQVVKRLVEVANNQIEDHISKKVILEKCSSLLNDNSDMIKYFGDCLLTLVDDHIAKSKGVWYKIKCDDYKQWINRLFGYLINDQNHIPKAKIIACLSSGILAGLQNLNIASALNSFMEPITVKIVTASNEYEKINLMKIAYMIAFETIANNRVETSKCLMEISKVIFKNYNARFVRDDQRSCITKILDLAIETQIITDDDAKLLSEDDFGLLLENCFNFVEQEIARMDHALGNVVTDSIFIDFATKVCTLSLWNDFTWTSSNCNEQPHKKMKFLNKFPALISRTEGTSSNRRQVNKYSWRWILILCKITEKHPELITNDDYETILQLLSDFQTRIQKPEEFYGFYIGVKSLLDYEKKNQTCINQKQLNEYWENISKNAVRNCCSINPVSNENLLLVRLILIYKQHKGEQFIESLLDTYFTDSIRRSNDSIHTLITILLTFNIHIFKDVDAKVEKILAFLLCKKMNEKKLLSEKFFDKADPVLIAKCVVLCNLHKTTFNESIKSEWLEESVNFGLDKWETDDYKIYVRALNSIKDAILIQLNHKPIIETIEKNEGKNSSPLLSQESVVVIDETSFGSFCAKILPAESQMACSQTTDDQESVPDLMQDKMYKLAIVIHTFNFFIKVNAVSRETFDKFRLSKLIGIIIPTLEEDFGELDASENYHKKIEMMKLLKEIFNPNFCQVVMKIVRNVTWTKCLTWVANVLKKGGDLEELGQDKFMTLKRLPLEIFAAFLSENGKDVARAETFFRNCLSDDGKILNFESCSIDACIFLDVFLILNQSKRISEPIAIDGLNCMVKILKSQYQNIKIVDKLLKIVPVYLNFYKQFAEETSRVTITVLGLVQAAKHYYPLHVIRKILGLIKFYVKAYPTEDAKKICDHIYYFLKSNCVYILASAGQAYINMINPNWVQNLSESNVQEIEYVFEDAVDFYLKKLTEMTEENEKAPIVMICTQLFPTVICTNFKLRNKAIMAFLDFCNVVNLPSNKMKTFFNMLNESCGNGCDVTKYFKDDLQRILTHWVAKEYPFAKFPYYITGEASLDDFLTTNCKTMSIAFFISNENLVQKLCQSTNKSEEMLMREVMPELLVEILPILSSTENYTPEQNQKAKELAIKIKNVPNSSILLQEAINHILELLIQRFMDRDFTQKYLQTTINSRNDTHDQLTLQQLDCCSNYLKRQVQGNKSEKSLFLIMCENTPYCIQKLLLSIESRLDASNSEEQKITCLSQYIFVFEHVKIFIKSNNNINLSKFFVINMVHFMCNQINGADEQVSKAAFFYFNHTCDDLIQTEFESFKTCLSFIVHTLVQNVVSSGNSQKIVKFLQKLLITEKKLFESEIVLLPDFPKKAEFQLLQDNLTAVRNQLEQNTLLAQIEQFFQIQFKTVETLNSLHASLASKKLELVEMYKEASSIKFSDQTEKSVLHRLVNKLVAIVEGPDETKAYEAAKCLGELGPADLYTLALYRENDNILYKLAVDSNDAESCIHQQLLDCLQDLIFDKNIKIKKVANEILIQVMSSVIGQSFKDEWPLFEIFILSASPKFGSVLKLDNTAANMNITNIFVQTRVEDYKTWIQQVCGKLFTLFGNEQINNLIKLLPELAETLLASAIKLCFTLNNDALLSALNNEINNFFSEFYAATQTSDKFYQNTLIVKTMLMVYECCRVQEKDNIIPKIKPNYLHLIKASEYCKAYFSCILYSQLWSSTEAISNKAISNVFYNVKLNKEIATSLQKAYHAIGIQDAENYLVDPLENRENYLIQRGAWSQVLLEQPLCNPYIWMENGFYESAYKMYGSEYKEIAFENLWRLSEWTIFDQDEPTENLNTTFQKSHYESLRCLHTTDKTGIKKHIRDARFSVIEMIKKTAAECPKNLYKLFGYLEMLQQIDDIYLVRIEKGDPEILLAKWAMNDNLPKTEFELVEMKLSQRVALLKECGVVANRSWVPKILPNTIFDVIRTAVQADKLNIAIKNISKMKALGKDLDRYFDSMLKLQDAQLNWKLNNCKLSKMILNDLLDRNETPILVKIEANFLMGHYEKGNTSIEVAMNTYNKYFKEAHSLLVKYAKNQNLLEELRQGIYRNDKTGNHLKDLSKIFGTIAKFFDEQQTALNKYFKSEEYTKKKNVLARLEYSLNSLNKKYEKRDITKDELKQRSAIKQNYCADKAQLDKYTSDRNMVLAKAIRYYTYACQWSETESLHIFRLVSLWLSNKNVSEVYEVIIGEAEYEVPEDAPENNSIGLLDTLPSYMFLNILPQLCVHLSNETDKTYFDEEIYELLKRCAIAHPHHTLNHLMALANSYADHSSKGRKGKPEARVEGAKKLISDLREGNQNIREIIDQLTTMTDVLIKLANEKLREKPGKFKFAQDPSKDDAILRLKNLNKVHCPTVALPIIKSLNYDDYIVTIQKWKPDITVLGGINAPKKLDCVCSDGIVRPQLLKGNDDLRQDAVMQQVFNIMNTMLIQNPKSVERRLQVRTYKVIPFSRRSGMLEWCSNTQPIGIILNHCHNVYRPHDKVSPSDARKIIGEATSPSDKLKKFRYICENLKPAFHSFFLNQFLTPGSFYERQYTFTNSIATNSIIGYILGIGDRHVANILLDQTTTEVVHIDFGIAFDQGKCLPTPETIPFRLTRDIIAGMGVTGVEGVFRRSAEITMQVLRDNQHAILAILEVLLHDPLYLWTLTPEKIKKTQSIDWDMPEEEEQNINTSAERALQVCREKINGSGFFETCTVEHQVDNLIEEARSMENLSRLFNGWQAYL